MPHDGLAPRERKAKRLRDERRVVLGCGDGGLEATVAGDTAVYQLTLTEIGWLCPCDARVADCAHVLAVEAVTGWRR